MGLIPLAIFIFFFFFLHGKFDQNRVQKYYIITSLPKSSSVVPPASLPFTVELLRTVYRTNHMTTRKDSAHVVNACLHTLTSQLFHILRALAAIDASCLSNPVVIRPIVRIQTYFFFPFFLFWFGFWFWWNCMFVLYIYRESQNIVCFLSMRFGFGYGVRIAFLML